MTKDEFDQAAITLERELNDGLVHYWVSSSYFSAMRYVGVVSEVRFCGERILFTSVFPLEMIGNIEAIKTVVGNAIIGVIEDRLGL